jgi:hypothetical protein
MKAKDGKSIKIILVVFLGLCILVAGWIFLLQKQANAQSAAASSLPVEQVNLPGSVSDLSADNPSLLTAYQQYRGRTDFVQSKGQSLFPAYQQYRGRTDFVLNH